MDGVDFAHRADFRHRPFHDRQGNATLLCADTVASLCSDRFSAEFGSADAFISHSQHDQEAFKWFAVSRWAWDFEADYGRKPRVWYDRVCIPSDTAAAVGNLSILPLTAMGCRRLVCLVGPTYASRLWALVETLTFLWSQGGQQDNVVVLPLVRPRSKDAQGGVDRLWYSDNAALLDGLKRIDITTAECFCERDRQWLLAAIESSLGTTDRLNGVLSEMLHSRTLEAMREEVEGEVVEATPLVSELAPVVFLDLTDLIVEHLPLEDLILIAARLDRSFCAAARRRLAELWALCAPLFSPPLSLSRKAAVKETWLLRNDAGVRDRQLTPLIRACANGALASLKELDLGNNHISDGGLYRARNLVASLTCFQRGQILPKLVLLHLGGNIISDDGAALFAEICLMGVFQCLEELCFYPNFIGDRGVAALMDGCLRGALTQLRLLSLSENYIGDEGVIHLTTACLEGGVLSRCRELFLGDNRIGDLGMDAITEALARGALPQLSSIDLKRNRASFASTYRVLSEVKRRSATLGRDDQSNDE